MIRYDDMRVDRLLIKEYQRQLETGLKRTGGLNDLEEDLRSFEKEFAAYIGVRHALAVNSGTDALQLALLTLGIGKGDRVLLPNVTYPAVALSVLYVGAKPVLVDVKEDLELDEKQVECKLSQGAKAVIAVHMFARPCAIKAIMTLARRHGFKVIEDCCQAESSTLQGKKLGSFADMSCFSFSYYKPLSSCGGGGGMVCFDDTTYASVVEFTRMGVDSPEQLAAGQRFARMNFMDLMAVTVKWRYLKEIIKSRQQIRALYEAGLAGCNGIHIFPDPAGVSSVAQNFVICLEQRDELGELLARNGVRWQKPYTPLNRMQIFRSFARGDYSQSDKYFRQAIQLPLYSFMKKEEASKIIDIIRKFTLK